MSISPYHIIVRNKVNDTGNYYMLDFIHAKKIIEVANAFRHMGEIYNMHLHVSK